ncbi:MAG: ribonuclease III [Clostridiales bacterium]|jgi:ribonuclease-3|nr:ribonuclease III [Clostridiales bacterium]
MIHANIEEILGYCFNNADVLNQALIHSSYVNENRMNSAAHNERLEFLGDAVLELATSEYIYTCFPDMTEGEMSKLRASVVNEATLAKCARERNFGEFLKLGRGEMANGGAQRESILADTFEAIIGAIYLDGGYDAAKGFILRALETDIHSMKGLTWISDCKTHLQEQLQKNSQEPIEYYVIKEEGPEHNKIFTVELAHGGRVMAQGSGRNKKEAEQEAARRAIEKYGLQ